MRNRPTKQQVQPARDVQPSLEPVVSVIETPKDRIDLVSDNPVVATVIPERRVELPLPARYRVLETGNVMYAGNRVILRKGKIVDARSYDLDVLRSQGIRLIKED
jgi:hypothetical protein